LAQAASWSGELGEVKFSFVPVCESDNYAGVSAHGLNAYAERWVRSVRAALR